jgi:hypothetical protein
MHKGNMVNTEMLSVENVLTEGKDTIFPLSNYVTFIALEKQQERKGRKR